MDESPTETLSTTALSFTFKTPPPRASPMGGARGQVAIADGYCELVEFVNGYERHIRSGLDLEGLPAYEPAGHP
jgi:hypothetical protein